MLITILVPIVSDNVNIPRKVNNLMSGIDRSGYKRENIEVVFAVLGSEVEGVRKLKVKPMIRVVQLRGRTLASAMSYCLERCYGDFFLLADLSTSFDVLRIKEIEQEFIKNQRLALVVNGRRGIVAVRKCKVKFPADLFDLKTYLILYSVINNYGIRGRWGALHKLEVLRFLYKMGKLNAFQKTRIFATTRWL